MLNVLIQSLARNHINLYLIVLHVVLITFNEFICWSIVTVVILCEAQNKTALVWIQKRRYKALFKMSDYVKVKITKKRLFGPVLMIINIFYRI